MRFTLRLKLALVLVFLTAAVVSGMFVIMQWSFERGFIALVETRQNAQVQTIVARLAQEYVEAGGWTRLRADRRRWAGILYASRPDTSGHPPHWVQRLARGTSNEWPPRRGGPVFDKPADHTRVPSHVPLEFRMMLLDVDRTLVFGTADAVARLDLRPIRVERKLVGWLGTLPGPPLDEVADIQFIDRQSKTFLSIAVAMVLLSAALAVPLAAVMTGRLHDITDATRALATGRFATRLKPISNDELGQLAGDVNELAKALEKAEQNRRRWVADISHELRTPLAVLRGELEALQDGVRPLDANAIDSLHADALRLGRLVEDLFELAMSDSGALTYHKVTLEPLEVLADDLAAMRAEFSDRRIEVQFNAAGLGDARIHGDPDRLSQLFRNLLTNTLRYTDPGGRLDVRASCTDSTLSIEFHDTAPGVPAEDLDRLFERFHRVESSRNRAHGGAGLGLAICRSIVDAHAGTISAVPSPLGGLCIRVTFPLQV